MEQTKDDKLSYLSYLMDMVFNYQMSVYPDIYKTTTYYEINK